MCMLSLKRTDGKTSPNRQNEKDVRFENIPTVVWRFQTTSVRLMGKQPEAGDMECEKRYPKIRPTLGLQRMWWGRLKYCVSWLLLSLHVKIENRRIIGEMFETLQSNCAFLWIGVAIPSWRNGNKKQLTPLKIKAPAAFYVFRRPQSDTESDTISFSAKNPYRTV